MSNEYNATHIADLEKLIHANIRATDTGWIANCTYLVFLMQCGFCLLEAGNTRYKNYISAMIKNAIDICVGTIMWWLWGYAFAFGDDRGRFIGASYFAGDQIDAYDEYNNWMFQWAFAGTSATIVSGCVLERMKIWGYVLFSCFMTSWIYPLVVHWCWHPEGWLKHLGYLDFAGSGVVHMVGGTAGLTATLILGARKGRFNKDGKVIPGFEKEFKPTYQPFIVLGTLMLWFSWYGFNCGSTINIVGNEVKVGKVGMNTSISGAVGGLTSFTLNYIINYNTDESYSLSALCNGILGGLVSITAGCAYVTSWAAVIIGFISAFIYWFYSWLLKYLKIDDPLDACPVHMGTGSWGLVALGWFHETEGIFYSGKGKLFGVNLLGVIVIFFWTFIWSFLALWLLKCLGILRISHEDEHNGVDQLYCGGYANHYDSVSRKYLSELFNSQQNNPKDLYNNTAMDANLKDERYKTAPDQVNYRIENNENLVNTDHVNHGSNELNTELKNNNRDNIELQVQNQLVVDLKESERKNVHGNLSGELNKKNE